MAATVTPSSWDEKIDMPVVAAQLAVRDGAQADRFLPCDDGANAVVFGLAQRAGGQSALPELGARRSERRGTQ